MSVTWKINGRFVADIGFDKLRLRLINQLPDTLEFLDAGTFSGRSYDTPPTVSITGGGGSGATGTTTVADGIVDSITLTAPGSGFTSTPTVALSGEGSATAVAHLTPTTVASLSLTSVGSNFTSVPIVAITGGGGSGAEAVAVLAPRGVASATVVDGGTGYTSAPTVGFSGGGGSGATGVALLSGGAVVGVTITDTGTGYTSAPTVSFTGGGGTGAAATASLADRGLASIAVTSAGSYGTSRSEFVSSLSFPAGLAVDSSGNLFVGDSGTGEVYKVTPAGTKSTFVSISQAVGLAVDSADNLFVGQYGVAGNVYKVTPAGSSSLFANVSDLPLSAAFDAAGNLYIGQLDGTISKITPAASVSTFATLAGRVSGLAFDSGGDLYASSFDTGAVYKITPAASISTHASGMTQPGPLVMGPDGQLYVASVWLGGVYRITAAGTVSTALDGFTYTRIEAVTVDASGNLFAANKSSSEDVGIVTKVATAFATVTIVGGGGTGATARAIMTGTNTFTIASFEVKAAGTGFTSTPTVAVSGTGTGTATLTPAGVGSISVTAGGSGYTSAPTVGFSGGGGSGAAATAVVAQTVASVTITNPGSGYTSTPTVSLTGGDGSGASATAVLEPGPLASLTLTNPGSGFTATPDVAISGGGGIGATATATLTPTTVASLEVTHPGGPLAVGGSVVLTRVEDGGEPVTWFQGILRKPPRRLLPESEVVAYVAEGPWQWLERVAFLQNFKTPSDPSDVESALVSYLRGRAIIAQADDGSKVSAKVFLEDVIAFCAAAVNAKYGFTPFTASVSAALNYLIPWDEVTDLSCADAMSRVLSLLPDTVCWFDYSVEPPVLNVDRRQTLSPLTLPIVAPGGAGEFAEAKRAEITLAPLPKQQREGVVLIYIATNRANDAAWETYEIDEYPPGTVPNDPDVLVRTIQLAGSIVNATVLTQKVNVDPIPSALVFSGNLSSGASFDTVKAWWRKHARELLSSNVTIKSFRDGTRTLSDESAISGDCPNELVKGAITDWMEDVQGVKVEDQIVSVTVELEITDPLSSSRKERVKKQLTASIKATDAQTKTYSFTASVSVTPPEEVPLGLAQAIYDAISPLHFEGAVKLVEAEPTVNSLVGRALNISGDDPAWETMIALVQEAMIDIDEGYTQLVVGPPRHLGVGDLIDLFRVNRIRPQAQSWETRTTGQSGTSSTKPGLSFHHPQTPVAGAKRVEPRVFTASLTMAGVVPTQAEITTALESAYNAASGNTPVVGDYIHLTVSGTPKLSYRVTQTGISSSGVNVVPFTVDSVSYRGWLSQMGLF